MQSTAKQSVFLIGVLFLFFLSFYALYAATEKEKTLLETEQQNEREKSGTYFSDTTNKDYQIHTYEELCKGYYTIEYQKDGTITSIGYGDLAEKYTFDIQTDISTLSLSSSTPSTDTGSIHTGLLSDIPLD